MTTLRLVLGDQLDRGVSALQDIDRADDIVLIVNAFVHPSASIAKRVSFNNYKAVRQAVRKAIEGRPTMKELVNEKVSARHPFRYAP